ncbi:MAG: MFS transporter, partial [Bacteroidota bacterium]
RASLFGLLTFFGLVAAALIQPLAGAASDRLRPRLGRRGFIGIALLLMLTALLLFGVVATLPGIILGYLAVQVSGSLAQAGQQGLIPDVVDKEHRGLASGFKGFMDLAGAMVGFVLLGQLLSSDRVGPALGMIAAALLAAYLLAVLLTPEDRRQPSAAPVRTDSWLSSFRLDFPERAPFLRLLAARFLFLLGIYATGRFLLFFVADRLGLGTGQAAQQAGNLLAGLALITVLASPLTGWLADRFGRLPLIISGAILGALSALLLTSARTSSQILLFGALMSLGSAAFSGGSWAMLADLVPADQSARLFGIANLSTAGAAAAAGLLGLLVDAGNRFSPGSGYSLLFVAAAIAFMASAFPLRHHPLKEDHHVGQGNENQRGARPDDSGLAVVPLSTGPASPEEDQNPP